MHDRNKKLFYEDLRKIYLILEQRQKDINSYFDILNNKKCNKQKRDFIDNFLNDIKLTINKENRLSVINRLVNLRDDSLIQALKKEDFSEDKILEIKENAYLWVSKFYIDSHSKIIHKINSLKLLTPFYRAVLEGVHEVGKSLSSWQSSWTAYIINGVNKELYRLFEGDEEKIFKMLNEKELFDKNEEGKQAQRSYSVLVKTKDGYKNTAYSEAFSKEVKNVIKSLEKFKLRISVLKDDIFHQECFYQDYLQAIINAFSETNTDKLITKWADVDRIWMGITSPLQIGHPLEYYEDHYRKAVALEWDIRISNPNYNQASNTKKTIQDMFDSLFTKISDKNKYKNIYKSTLSNLNKVQLYIGRPLFFYGAEFCGLFSAQVVPNDESVSSKYGKKIFAFADNILDSLKAKPTLKINEIVFGKQFLKFEKDLIFNKKEIWHKVYDVTTIGHEFGHILWMDKTSETLMNKTGNFKNIEEFKATTGGLMAFFLYEQKELSPYILRDLTKRAVGLIAWKETAEVEPYYCEGLIHLDILFQSGVLCFDGTLSIDLTDEKYINTKKIYQKMYEELARTYLQKQDATKYLNKFVKKEGKYFMPVKQKVKSFVEYYWDLHKEIGRVVA